METTKILSILDLHGVVYSINGSRIIADGDDVTGYSFAQLKRWLGY